VARNVEVAGHLVDLDFAFHLATFIVLQRIDNALVLRLTVDSSVFLLDQLKLKVHVSLCPSLRELLTAS